MKEPSSQSQRLQELVGLAVLAGLGWILFAHREIAAAAGYLVSRIAVVAAVVTESVYLVLHVALALAGAGVAVRAAAWLLDRWEGHG